MMKVLTFTLLFFILSCNNHQDEPKTSKTETVTAAKKLLLERAPYKMEYFDNWKIDSSIAEYDLDSYFVINAPSEAGFVTIFILNKPIDEKKHIEEQVKANLDETIKNGNVTYFNSWGNYSGTGAAIEGKVSGLFEGVIKVFACSKDKYSFIIASQLLNSDKAGDEPGLKLIESSFKITE